MVWSPQVRRVAREGGGERLVVGHRLVDALDGHQVILDGELVALPGQEGGFYSLAPQMMYTGRMAQWAAGQIPVTFMTFDLLHLDGQDLTGRPLIERKRLLDGLHLVGPAWATNSRHPGDSDTLFQVCAELGHEGIVAKGLDAPYLPGKRQDFGSSASALRGSATMLHADDHACRRNRCTSRC